MKIQTIKNISSRTLALVSAALLLVATFFTLMQNYSSAASQITSRSVAMSSAVPGATSTTYAFTFTPAAGVIQSMQFQFCDSPVAAACNGTNNPTLGAVTVSAQSGWSQTPAWSAPTVVTDAGGGTATSNEIKLTRTGGTSGSSETAVAKSISFDTITNNASANKTFYVRIRLYADTTWTTVTQNGNVAGSTSQTLTINARVQEVLNFCVGQTTVDDATTAVPSTCAGTSVDLGVIDNSGVSITPVAAATYGGDGYNGVALVTTNAQSGVTISYYSGQNTSSGKLKVAGAACSGTLTTDQCFNSVGTTHAFITEGVEKFGMTIAGVNCGLVTAYTCTFSSGAYNLTRDANYDGIGSNTYTAEASYQGSGTYVTSNKFAWEDTTAIDQIASSTTVVDHEALILKFAATASSTTPTGTYAATASYLAIPTF